MLELKKNNLEEKKEENIKFLKQYFNVTEESPNDKVYIIDKIGRAVNLTKEDIDYINSIGDKTTKYMLGNKKILEKFCPNCGKKVSSDAKFCTECGNKLV